MSKRLPGSRSPWFQRWLKARIPPASRVELNHRRIFILPTRAGLGLLLLLVIILIGAINYQNSLIHVVVFLLGSLFWVGLHHTYRNLSGLELRAIGCAPVFAGEEAGLNIGLRAAQREQQAIALFWADTLPRRVDVQREHSASLTLYYPTTRRGLLTPGRLRVETRYPLGWFVAWSLVDLDWQVLVYPKPLQLPLPLSLSGGAADDGRNGRMEGVDDFQGLRSYQPGDSKRRVDWRAWSRGQGLHSKIFSEAQSEARWLKLEQAPGSSVELQLSCLTGWVLRLERMQQPYGLDLGGQRIAPATGDAHQYVCLRALALYGAEQ